MSYPSYILLCLLYYSFKSVCIILGYTLWYSYSGLFDYIYKKVNPANESEEILLEIENEDKDKEEITFCQLFRISDDMSLLVDHVEMCPDETAFIRVVDDNGYTPLYKRKVQRDKAHNRFIKFNGMKYYLDDNKTSPIISL